MMMDMIVLEETHSYCCLYVIEFNAQEQEIHQLQVLNIFMDDLDIF